MDSAFAWIGQIMEWFGNFVPRLKLIRRTHGGVKFVGSKVVELKSGWHFYWPLTTEVEVLPVVRQTHNLVTQTLTTKDDKSVIVGAVVIYEINDVIAAKGESWDIDDTVSDITQLAVLKVVNTWAYDDLKNQLYDKVENELSIETRRQLKPFGIKVIRCGISDFAPCRVIRLVNDAEVVNRH